MAQAEDLDMTIDGFNPDLIAPRNRRSRRKATSETEEATYMPPRTVTAPPATLRTPPKQEYSAQPAVAVENPTIQRPVASPAAEPQIKEKKAKPTETRQDKEEEQPRGWRSLGIVRFFTDNRTKVFLGITLLLMSVFVVIALASHFKNAASDQSVIMNSTIAEIAANPASVENVAGGFGAWLAKVFMCDSLGLGSAVMVIYVWVLGLGLLGYKKVNFWSLTFKCLLVAITLSLVLGLLTYTSPTALRWGGIHGHYANGWIMDRASWIGATLVSATLILAVVCVYLNEIHTAWNKWRQALNTRRAAEQYRKEKEKSLNTPVDVAKVKEEAPAQETQSAAEAEPEAETTVEEAPEQASGFSISPTDLEPQAEPSPYAPAPMPEPMSIHIDEPEANPASADSATAGLAQGFVLDTYDEAEDSAKETEPTPVEEVEKQTETEAIEPKPETIEEGFSVIAPEIEMADNIEDMSTAQQLVEKEGYYDHRAELSKYKFPEIDLLEDRPSGPVIDYEEQQANKERIVDTLLKYSIPVAKIEATVGPTVTRYEIVPGEGVRVSQIKRLEDDIALNLAALGIRIIAPIPGKGTVGIEVPNKEPQTVSMRSIIASKKYQESKMNLPMAMGATISNEIFMADLTKMPHLLVAGATGMGKSVGLNAIIASLLYKKHPSELKLVLVDPKMVEFSLYSRLERHFLAKLPEEEDAIITDTKKVIQTLNSLCVEMDNRYTLLKDANVRTLEEYNKKFSERRLSPANGHKYLPYIVVIVDEFADLIMTAGKEVETPIARITQKARAVGIHMIIATQRPTTNVITGLIKSNIPGRIAFRVIQMVDSRTILDATGANQLIGRGDMLFSHNGNIERVQCAFLSTEEVEAIVDSIDAQVGYPSAYYLPEYVPETEGGGGDMAGAGCERDALFDDSARFIVSRNNASTSSLQRQFNIGYNRAGRLMDQMEAAGIIGPPNGAKPRAILVTMTELEYMLEQK